MGGSPPPPPAHQLFWELRERLYTFSGLARAQKPRPSPPPSRKNYTKLLCFLPPMRISRIILYVTAISFQLRGLRGTISKALKEKKYFCIPVLLRGSTFRAGVAQHTVVICL